MTRPTELGFLPCACGEPGKLDLQIGLGIVFFYIECKACGVQLATRSTNHWSEQQRELSLLERWNRMNAKVPAVIAPVSEPTMREWFELAKRFVDLAETEILSNP